MRIVIFIGLLLAWGTDRWNELGWRGAPVEDGAVQAQDGGDGYPPPPH